MQRWKGLEHLVAGAAIALLAQAGCDDEGPERPPGGADPAEMIGVEVAVPRHLEDGEEHEVTRESLIEHGRLMLAANWTVQEGQGRPLMDGTGNPLADPGSPLTFPRSFNRVSGPDANSCAGCHNAPFGMVGGGGDVVANVFVLAQRFDFATFAREDEVPHRGTLGADGEPATLQSIGNSRATLGMFGSGFVEMLARQITADLQGIRDDLAPGESAELSSKGISYGVLARDREGAWDTSRTEGLPPASLASSGPEEPPSLVIRPFHQVGAVVSLRQFTINAMIQHHGIQAVERFGDGVDADGDGVVDELTRADVTAAAVFQATMPVPGRVIPEHPAVEAAVLEGEELFESIGCADCHIPALPLEDEGWIFVEPNPFNPPGNLQPEDARELAVDLTDGALPGPRLEVEDGVVWVPVFTDLKLHDITTGPDDPNREPLDQHAAPGSEAFFEGNGRFLTKKLWGAANEPPFFHHGRFTTLREAVLSHAGEAQAAADAFAALSDGERDSVIEFLKTLQVLPPGTKTRVVDGRNQPRAWPPGPR